jgi:hypothetical protein
MERSEKKDIEKILKLNNKGREMRKEVNSIWDSKKVLSEEKKGGGQ